MKRLVFGLMIGLLSVPAEISLAEESGTQEASEQAANNSEHLQSVMTAASEAVVRIKLSSKQAITGIIVSDDGYVIWPGRSHELPGLSVALANGESVQAANLGWSEEWSIGLLKLTQDRKWPHVQLGTTAHSKPGDRIFEIGYRAKSGKEGEFDLITRTGKLNFLSPSHWFATDLEHTLFEYGAGTFDEDGRLLGISVPGVSNMHQISTATDIVTSNWQELADGKNLDWLRFPPSMHSLYRQLAAPKQLDRTGFIPTNGIPAWNKAGDSPQINPKDFQKAQTVAETTVVRIRLRSPPNSKTKENDCWSGVLISKDGYVATCAHTRQMAGEEVIVVVPGNREAHGVTLGTNWVSDIGLVKITEQGSWPFAKLGDSSLIGPTDAVLCAGFPVPDATPLPPVSTDTLWMQHTPYVGWNQVLNYDLGFKLDGGSSGGGVFDREGKLVAIYLGPGDGLRIEMLQAEMEYLKHEERVKAEP